MAPLGSSCVMKRARPPMKGKAGGSARRTTSTRTRTRIRTVTVIDRCHTCCFGGSTHGRTAPFGAPFMFCGPRNHPERIPPPRLTLVGINTMAMPNGWMRDGDERSSVPGPHAGGRRLDRSSYRTGVVPFTCQTTGSWTRSLWWRTYMRRGRCVAPPPSFEWSGWRYGRCSSFSPR